MFWSFILFLLLATILFFMGLAGIAVVIVLLPTPVRRSLLEGMKGKLAGIGRGVLAIRQIIQR